MKKATFFILFFLCLGLNAQVRHLFDTIKYDLTQKKRFFISLDGKNNIVSDIKIKTFGIQGGYIYNNRTSFYVGFYNTHGQNSRIFDNPTALPGKTDSNTVYSSFGMGFINFGCEYIFHNSKRWKLSVPVALGIGAGRHTKVSQGSILEIKRPGIVPLEIGIKANFKLTWWLWIGGGLGTRVSLNSNHQFNGPYYSFSLQFQTEAMIKKVTEVIKKHQ